MPQNARDVIVATGLADEIAFRLQAAVLDGEYAPGTHLNQDDLCARFGVSRTPVREALRKLQAQHLVELVLNKGATVRVPTRKELDEVYAVRAELEGYACELAAGKMKPEAIANLRKLQAAVAEQIELLEADAVDTSEEAAFNSRVTRANERFHAAIYRAAGNERLVAIIGLQNYFPKDYVWRATRHRPEGHQLGVENHERIVSALEAGDGTAARAAMEEHIRFAGACSSSTSMSIASGRPEQRSTGRTAAVAATVVVGAALAFVAPIDGGLSRTTGALPAALVDFAGGTLLLVAVLAATRRLGDLRGVRDAPPGCCWAARAAPASSWPAWSRSRRSAPAALRRRP